MFSNKRTFDNTGINSNNNANPAQGNSPLSRNAEVETSKKRRIEGSAESELYTTQTSVISRNVSITHYDHGDENIHLGATLDLTASTELKKVNIGEVKGCLRLPSSVAEFKCKNIASGVLLDLRHCKNLTSFEVGKLDGGLKLPLNIPLFKCGSEGFSIKADIGEGALMITTPVSTASSKAEILPEVIKVEDADESERTYESRYTRGLNLNDQPYTKVKIETVDGSFVLPQNIQIFECEEMFASLDLSKYTKLHSVKVKSIKNDLLTLPSSLINFECGYYIYSKGELNWSRCQNLKSIEMGEVAQPFMLPGKVSSFKCTFIKPHIVLDWHNFRYLQKVILNQLSGTLILPENTVDLKCETIFSKGLLNLALCSKLKLIQIGLIGGSLILPSDPSTLTSFEYGSIDPRITIDLSGYYNLSSIKRLAHFGHEWGEGKLILPIKNKSSLLQTLPTGANVEWR